MNTTAIGLSLMLVGVALIAASRVVRTRGIVGFGLSWCCFGMGVGIVVGGSLAVIGRT